MEKVDILIILIGIACYMAIIVDLRGYERRLAQYEEIQEKKRQYSRRIAEKQKAEKARAQAAERKAARQMEVQQLSGVVEKLGAMEDEEIMRKTKVTAGRI